MRRSTRHACPRQHRATPCSGARLRDRREDHTGTQMHLHFLIVRWCCLLGGHGRGARRARVQRVPQSRRQELVRERIFNRRLRHPQPHQNRYTPQCDPCTSATAKQVAARGAAPFKCRSLKLVSCETGHHSQTSVPHNPRLPGPQPLLAACSSIRGCLPALSPAETDTVHPPQLSPAKCKSKSHKAIHSIHHPWSAAATALCMRGVTPCAAVA